MGLSGGLLGFDVDDERLINLKQETKKANVEIIYQIGDFGDLHANTYNITLKNGDEEHTLVANSTGGGMLEVTKIDGVSLSYYGDCFGCVIRADEEKSFLLELHNNNGCKVPQSEIDATPLVFATRSSRFDDELAKIS